MGSTEKETASVILDILDPVVNFVPTKINTDPSAIKVSTILFSPLNTSGELFFFYCAPFVCPSFDDFFNNVYGCFC